MKYPTRLRKIISKFPIFDGKVVLITGGTGTWGQEFTSQLLKHSKVSEIRLYARNEYQQTKVRRRFSDHSDKLRFIIGDVRDKERLGGAAKGVNFIIHLAALKHVPIVEENPFEAVLTNIIGTQNVIDVSSSNDVEKVLYVSSDKAVNPLNLYGVTKLVGEQLVVNANDIPGTRTAFITFRGGNVMGSQGSVVPVFQEQILRSGVITVTDPSMTRFFMSVGDIVRYALRSIENGIGGEIFIPPMKATRLSDIMGIMVEELGDSNTKIEKIDVRPGEKLHELLITEQEAPRARKFKDMYVILPYFPSEGLKHKYSSMGGIDDELGSDGAKKFTKDELHSLIKSGGFLEKLPPIHTEPLHFKKGKYRYF